MLFNTEDKPLNKNLRQFTEYGSQKILTEFSKKNWKNEGLNTLLKKIHGNRKHWPKAWQRQIEAVKFLKISQ